MLDSKLLKYNISNYKFLCFDVESEGLNLLKSRPWEIAWTVYHGYNKIESHQHFVKWHELNVSIGAAKATGFNPAIIEEKGENPKDVIDLFDNYIYNKEYKLITANGLGFDTYIHNLSRKLLGYKTDYSYLDRMYDILSMGRAYRLGIKPPEEKKDFLAWQYRLLQIFQKGLKCKNAELAREFGFEVDESKLHIGAYDCELTAFSFFNLIKKIDIQ
jgi:hypothetical protein